jgi:NAD(P)-dependent dehydrogenase (short-subunit alcohol dehydrogenase family)
MKRHILLTGATGGLGGGAALGLAPDHHVIAAGETWSQVRDFREKAPEHLEVIKLDLLDPIDLDNAADRRIDVLVLNAGIQEAGSILDIPMERVRASFDVNVFGHLELVKRVLPQMLKRRRGRVVWMSSLAGILSPPFLGTYAATKHAIEAIAAAMRVELVGRGISVATINPGFYRTGFNDTGAEASRQWASRTKEQVGMPPMGPVLATQHDPQPMIDEMVRVIPDRRSRYRTMMPEDAVAEAKKAQELGWTADALGLP